MKRGKATPMIANSNNLKMSHLSLTIFGVDIGGVPLDVLNSVKPSFSSRIEYGVPCGMVFLTRWCS